MIISVQRSREIKLKFKVTSSNPISRDLCPKMLRENADWDTKKHLHVKGKFQQQNSGAGCVSSQQVASRSSICWKMLVVASNTLLKTYFSSCKSILTSWILLTILLFNVINASSLLILPCIIKKKKIYIYKHKTAKMLWWLPEGVCRTLKPQCEQRSDLVIQACMFSL